MGHCRLITTHIIEGPDCVIKEAKEANLDKLPHDPICIISPTGKNAQGLHFVESLPGAGDNTALSN